MTETAKVTHTPAPWHWSTSATRNPLWVLTNAQCDVVLTVQHNEFGPTAHPTADRPLIAAAPELLDLLRRLRQWDMWTSVGDGPFWIGELDAAIAKAEGRDS